MAVVKLGVAEIDIGKVDHSLTVWSTKKTKIGQLNFSKGSVEWWPKGNKVNAHTYTWAQFAKALESASDAKRVVAPAEPRTKKAPATKAGPTAKNKASKPSLTRKRAP
ncbi:hypothetical protein [Paraburkholderia kururiensis]|uniref:Uncharacterized protein n=1 Tax=Paraburkholderia kururiensis TaxID=984307 RepID=A0ABZ0WDT8_9BURK|nr:hypothetical protein [Paraburkholderia kururiensis]WQD75494.1 hypothetical protein U0042_15100 [Paraburkholderia kururiensis]